MIQRLRLAAAFAAAISLLVLAGPARAQAAGTAFTAGTGQHPDVAVDAAGTAHVVWLQPSGSTNVVAYCRVPRGQRACTGTQTFALDLEDITGRPWVFVNGATVTIVDHRCCNDETFALTSSDGGKTFGPPVPIGTGEPNGDGRLGPDGAFYGVSTITTGGTVFQRMPLSGPQATARANVGPGYEVGGAIAFLGGLPLVAFATISSTPTVAFARWSGTGDPNDVSTWTAPALVGPGDSTRLAEGRAAPS